jgi:hypothetical protein
LVHLEVEIKVVEVVLLIVLSIVEVLVVMVVQEVLVLVVEVEVQDLHLLQLVPQILAAKVVLV